ncbi:MAG: hypothetical protein KatS3mg102_1477 [Planctomycetota bacterium]|nr:MAG: hypothetical protein KatS3mg102_1477 [Planctomycetota bacterium]
MRLVVTAGPTREWLDAVRFLSNPSSGRMGQAIASAAVRRGHQVALVRGPVALPPPAGLVELREVETTEEMLAACLQLWPRADALVMAAAPADFRPETRLAGKLKKDALGEAISLRLVRTPDILTALARARRPGQLLVGFALEAEQGEAHARAKLERKGLDLIVLNAPSNFAIEHGAAITILGREGVRGRHEGSKDELAERVLEQLERERAIRS